MDKKERKEFRDQLAAKELAVFREHLPFDETIFPKLFDFLDIELEKKGCNHSIFLTMTFLEKNGISNTVDVH